jgi:hypothetical protein
MSTDQKWKLAVVIATAILLGVAIRDFRMAR